jgi:cyanophycinase
MVGSYEAGKRQGRFLGGEPDMLQPTNTIRMENFDMSYNLALIGGEEFSDNFQAIHANLAVERGRKTRVAFLPTPAANDGAETIEHWCALAREKLSALEAIVETPRVVDRESADDPRHAKQVAEADWVYLGGGYAHVAFPILQGTKVMDSLHSAKEHGALISGASAGAMMMGEQTIVITPELLEDIGKYWESGTPPDWDPPAPPLIPGLGWLPKTVVAPHFDRPWFSRKWLERGFLPYGFTLIGIDECTTLAQRTDGNWEVFGLGSVTIHKPGKEPARYIAGDAFVF